MAGVDIRTVQELMGHSTITMTMRYAHLSPAHLRAAVNKASLHMPSVTVIETVSSGKRVSPETSQDNVEINEMIPESVGGAERGRTAASQFCRLLP